jgi:hypothetical protein
MAPSMNDQIVWVQVDYPDVRTGGSHLWQILVALLVGGQSDNRQSVQPLPKDVANLDDTYSAWQELCVSK